MHAWRSVLVCMIDSLWTDMRMVVDIQGHSDVPVNVQVLNEVSDVRLRVEMPRATS